MAVTRQVRLRRKALPGKAGVVLKSINKVKILFLLAFASVTWAQNPICGPRFPDVCKAINQDMTAKYRATPDVRQAPRFPNGYDEALAALKNNGIPTFRSYTEAAQLSDLTSKKELVFQEWIRNFPGGMPWLPLSWGYGHYPLYHFSAYMPLFENAVRNKAPIPLNDHDFLLTYLWTTSVEHANTPSYAVEMRELAKTILDKDTRFAQLRYEVHEAPSLLTIRKLDDFLKTVAVTDEVRQLIIKLRGQLESLFGNGEITQFQQIYALTPDQNAPFEAYKRARQILADANDANKVNQVISTGEVEEALKKLTAKALETATSIREGKVGQSCVYDKIINCTFEYYDYLTQLNKSTFSLASQLIGRVREFGSPISYRDFLELSRALISASRALGLTNSTLETMIDDEIRNNTHPDQASIAAFIAQFETSVQGMITDYRGMFLAHITKYKLFSDEAEMFVDDTLRSTAALPLANLITAFKNSVLSKTGVQFYLNGQGLTASFQVLNPGIAHGVLIIPKGDEVLNPKFRWNPAGIYLFEKTPAALQKVAGVMTADSGSMISHVQLLASNHGLPNIFVSKALISRIAPFEGKEILLISLPNGEAQLKLWSDATADEIATFNEYYKVKDTKRTRLVIPPDLTKYTHPLLLSQLRMSHAGQIAGGKATGQAEVSSIPQLNNYVPKGVVLPFGVYYQHIKDAGIYDLIRNTFALPQFKGTTDDAIEFRKNALAKIKSQIMQIELRPELKTFIMAALLDYPYRDDANRRLGVFVRSDTNAEDLPGFVGAGLNLTIGNVQSIEDVFEAIKTVWASPFEERAFTWRNDLLENPWDILPSVVIQLGMPADKAGVMIVGSPSQTDDVEDTVYIAANEGLGFTTVGGEYTAEEVVVSRQNSYSYRRLKKSFATTRYVFRDANDPADPDAEKKFLKSVPVKGLDPIVTPDEAKELARVGDIIQKHVASKYKNLAKWDIEWCIVGGKVVIVQLRAFTGNKIARDVSSLGKLQKPQVTSNFSVQPQDRVFTLPDNQ